MLLHGGPPAEVTVPKDCWAIFIGPGLWLSEAVVGSDGVFGGKGIWGTLIFSLLLWVYHGRYGSMSSSWVPSCLSWHWCLIYRYHGTAVKLGSGVWMITEQQWLQGLGHWLPQWWLLCCLRCAYKSSNHGSWDLESRCICWDRNYANLTRSHFCSYSPVWLHCLAIGFYWTLESYRAVLVHE